MTGPFAVRYTVRARADLIRLHEFLLQRAETREALAAADDAIDAIEAAIEGQLRRGPFLFRKVDDDPFMRELVIPFRGSGYVALFGINGDSTVDVLAIRHQLEGDYHS